MLIEKNIFDKNISLFGNAKITTNPSILSLNELLNNIHNGTYAVITNKARELLQQDITNNILNIKGTLTTPLYDKYKKQNIPAFTLSAYCNHRIADNENNYNKYGFEFIKDKLIYHTNILQIDIDNISVKKVYEVKKTLENDPYTIFCFTSIGGMGIKAGIYIDGNQHLNAFNSAVEYYKNSYNYDIDKSVKDLYRLCFVSYDANLFVNKNAEIFYTENNIETADKIIKQEILDSYTSIDNNRFNEYAQQGINTANKLITDSIKGDSDKGRHNSRIKAAYLLGGYVAGGFFSEEYAISQIRDTVLCHTDLTEDEAMKDIYDAIKKGQIQPITYDDIEKERNNYINNQYGSKWKNKKNSTATSLSLAADALNNVENSDTTININKNKIKSSKECNIAILEQYLNEQYNLRYNIVKSQVEYQLKNNDSKDWIDTKDRFANEIWRVFQKSPNKIPINHIELTLNSEFVQSFHPFQDYFYNLPQWDTTNNYIQQYASLIKVPKEQEEIWVIYFMKWIVGAVACALEIGLNHSCIVLSGKQGIGKTTVIRNLVPEPLLKYYISTQINPNDKDSKIAIAEYFIINLDELESINREEIGLLKSLMTIDSIDIRRPYGRRFEKTKRRASFIGSVNKALFLTDISGNRRFLTVEALEIDLKSTINLNQMYAQALYLLNNGFQYWFEGNEIEKINEINLIYQMVNPEDDYLNKYYEPVELDNYENKTVDEAVNQGFCQLLTATEIMEDLQSKSIAVKFNFNKLGQTLKNQGFKQITRKINKRVSRYYIGKKRNIFNQQSLAKEPF
jgi:predicted P-loop ATPase